MLLRVSRTKQQSWDRYESVVLQKVEENEISFYVKRECVGRHGILNEKYNQTRASLKKETRHWELELVPSSTSTSPQPFAFVDDYEYLSQTPSEFAFPPSKDFWRSRFSFRPVRRRNIVSQPLTWIRHDPSYKPRTDGTLVEYKMDGNSFFDFVPSDLHWLSRPRVAAPYDQKKKKKITPLVHSRHLCRLNTLHLPWKFMSQPSNKPQKLGLRYGRYTTTIW